MNRHPKVDSATKGPHAVESNQKRTLIKNVIIFNGTSEKLTKGHDVVLQDDLIEKVIPSGSKEDAYGQVIDGGKRRSPFDSGICDDNVEANLYRCRPRRKTTAGP